jgi:hypothetical protein
VVTHSRATARADQLRPLNRPREIRVHTGKHGHPVIVATGRLRQPVREIQDVWRIDDEWWREPISRLYYRLLLANGHIRTVYHDLVTGRWHAQEY